MQQWKEPEYIIVNSEQTLNQLASELVLAIKANIPIAVDIETTGPTPKAALDPFKSWLLGLQFATCVNKGYYIPLAHTQDGDLVEGQLSLDMVINKLNPIIGVAGVYLGHNIKFDYKGMWLNGLRMFPNFWDTRIAFKMLSGNTRIRSALKEIIFQYVDIPYTKKVQKFAEAAHGEAAEQKIIKFAVYAIDDAIYTYYIYQALKPKIDAIYQKLFYEAEMPLIPVLAHMEMRGIVVDKPYFAKVRIPLAKCRTKIEEKFEKNFSIQIGSPKQVASLLMKQVKNVKDLGVPLTKLGVISTGVESLQLIKRNYKKGTGPYKIAKHILVHRMINKALTTYIDKYPKVCLEDFNADGTTISVLHTTFDQLKNSGRLSSSPNVQNISRDNSIVSVRRGFISRPNHLFVEADWSSCELRIVAIASQETKMLEAFKANPRNADLHTLTAQGIFQKMHISKEERHIGKTINFSILYGATEYSISKTLNCSKEKALDYLDMFFLMYPGIKKWKEDVESFVVKKGYAETFYGRRRSLGLDVYPNMHDHWKWDAAIRELTNHIIQGTNADILKFSMVQITRELAKRKLGAYPLTSTHDSILLESRKECAEEAAQIMKDVMEVKIGGILLPVNTEIKNSFAKAA